MPVINLQETIAYYRDKLGFSNEWTWGDKDGGISRDDMRLLFGEDAAHTTIINSETNRLNILWFADDIDSVYTEFKERGIEIAGDLKAYPYVLREFAFIDINGYYIRVAQSV